MFKALSIAALASAALCMNAATACDDHHDDKVTSTKAGHDDKHAHHAVMHTSHEYIRSTPPGSPNTAAFFHMHNTSEQDLHLSDLHSPAADAVEIHISEKQGEQVRMRKLNDWTLKKGETAEFSPGNMHVMFMGLKKPLVEGETVKLRLCFEEKSCQQIDLPVQSVLKGPAVKTHSHH